MDHASNHNLNGRIRAAERRGIKIGLGMATLAYIVATLLLRALVMP